MTYYKGEHILSLIKYVFLQAPFGHKVVLQFEGDFGIYCLEEVCYHWVEIRSGFDLSTQGPR